MNWDYWWIGVTGFAVGVLSALYSCSKIDDGTIVNVTSTLGIALGWLERR